MWFESLGSTTIELIPRPRNGVVARNRAGIRRVADARVAELRPVVALVGRLVDADAGLAAGGAAVGLARAEVERPVLRVGRVERQRPDRVLRHLGVVTRDLVPVGIRRERVVAAPDAAACDADPELALLRGAVRIGHEHRHAARGRVRRAGEGDHSRLGRVRLRAVELPLVPLRLRVAVLGVLLGDLAERGRRLGCHRRRDHVGRVGPLGRQVGVEADRPLTRCLALCR